MKYLLAVALLALAGCHGVGPDAGHEAVLIQKPWFFGHGGVVDAPVKTGLTFVAWTTTGVDVNMQPQRVEVDLPDTMTSDGVPIAFHAVLAYQVTASPSVNERNGPSTWFRIADQLPYGALAWVGCQKAGSQIKRTRVWDKLLDGHWVSDSYVTTPSKTTYSGPSPRC